MKEDPRNVYYNIRDFVLENDNIRPIRNIEYSSNRVLPILQNPSQYEVGVVRFDLPSNLPVTIWPEDQDVYRLQVSWDSTVITKRVIYPDLCTTCLYARAVYNTHSIVDILNSTLKEACDELKVIEGSFPYINTAPPFFFLDDENRFVFYTPESFNTTRFKFLMSIQMYEKFCSGLESIGEFSDITFRRVQIVIDDRQLNKQTVNGITYLFMVPSFNTIINDVTTILLETTMPINAEFEPSENNASRIVLTDFSISGETKKETISFFPQGPIRYYSMNSDYPLNKVDMKVYIQFNRKDTFPMVIASGQSFSVKLHFKKISRSEQKNALMK